MKMNERENDNILGNYLDDDLQEDAYNIELAKQKFSAKHNIIMRRNTTIIWRVAIALVIAFVIQKFT